MRTVLARGLLAGALFAFSVAPCRRDLGRAASECTASDSLRLLPAYAHNDYLNSNPLRDALALGYRGVEADLFLVGGQLLVAHDRRKTNDARTLEELYLRPLQERAARCGGRIYPDPQPFLLNLEAKEDDRATYEAIKEMLGRFAPLLTSVRDGTVHEGAVDVVLVGHHPGMQEIAAESPRLFRVQAEVQRREDLLQSRSASVVRLVSLDYSRTVRWSGARAPSRDAVRYFEAIERAKEVAPGCLIRVHHVPVDARIYARLLAAGVDLIGTMDLEASRRVLTATR